VGISTTLSCWFNRMPVLDLTDSRSRQSSISCLNHDDASVGCGYPSSFSGSDGVAGAITNVFGIWRRFGKNLTYVGCG